MTQPRTKYIRQCAGLLLDRHGLKTAPIDLELIVRKEGLEYEEVSYFDDELDALIIKYGDRMIAAVNKNHHIHRRRFSLAHELCHHLHHGDRTILEDRMTIDSDDEGTSTCGSRKDVYEREADIFAGELLVPLKLLKQHCNKPIEEISSIFVVSPEVVSIAISNHFSALF